MRILAVGLLAGLVSGVLVALLQTVTTTPIIIEAEVYENGGGHETHDHGGEAALQSGLLHYAVASAEKAELIFVHAGEDHGAGDVWAPEDGLPRTLYTSIATVGTAIGFAMILLAGMLFAGDTITESRAMAWAAAGFVATGLAPAVGLSPEVPGMAAAELSSRQAWWFATATCTAAALWLILRGSNNWYRLLGVAILVAPHVWGAPHLTEHPASSVPAHLAAQFASTSLAVHAVLWLLTGFFVGFWWKRIGQS
ncbi:CbtA family protein [Methyloligella sp. 2.7D]